MTFSSLLYVFLCKKAPAANSWRLGFSYNKKGMIGPEGAIMPNSLYPSGSLDQLPHFASPVKESAVISSVMVVLYPFLLHTVKPGKYRH